MTAPADPAAGPTRDGSRCGAKAKGTGLPCRLPAGSGTDHPGLGHCRFHGGASPGGRRMAEREAAHAAVRTYGLPLDIDPAEALLAEVRRSAGVVSWLEVKVGELAPEDLIRGTKYVRRAETTAGENPGTTTTSEAGPAEHMYLQLYRAERRHLADVCAKALAAGVAERHVRLAEEQGALAGRLVQAVLEELGLTGPEHAERAEVAIRRHLSLVRETG